MHVHMNDLLEGTCKDVLKTKCFSLHTNNNILLTHLFYGRSEKTRGKKLNFAHQLFLNTIFTSCFVSDVLEEVPCMIRNDVLIQQYVHGH